MKGGEVGRKREREREGEERKGVERGGREKRREGGMGWGAGERDQGLGQKSLWKI
jgi:hypothetical protein